MSDIVTDFYISITLNKVNISFIFKTLWFVVLAPTTLLLAIYGILSVSEYCTDLRVKHKCIQIGGVHISDIFCMTVSFSKTDQQGRSQTLMIA